MKDRERKILKTIKDGEKKYKEPKGNSHRNIGDLFVEYTIECPKWNKFFNKNMTNIYKNTMFKNINSKVIFVFFSACSYFSYFQH